MAAAAPKASKDATRPVFHFRPPAQWMNDICGAFYYKGHYHIFFQFHPWSDQWGTGGTGQGVGWGHARSTDLVRWQFLPPALLPSKETNEYLTASGCALIRKNGVPILFFTHTPIGFPEMKREQWAALPEDDELIRWRRVDIGLSAGRSGIPFNMNPRWADMYVFRIKDRVFAIFKESDGLVCEAQNDQLTSWRAVGSLAGHGPYAAPNAAGVSGECPNLFSLHDQQVLIRSTQPISYLIGAFDPDAVTFVSQDDPQILDYGYAANEKPDLQMRGLVGTTVCTDPEGRTILFGRVWSFKPNRGWNGCMCIPRILSIDQKNRLIQTPVPELRELRGKHTHIENLTLRDESKRIDGARGDTLEIIAEFTTGNAEAFGLAVRCGADWTHGLIIKYSAGKLTAGGVEVPLVHNKDIKTFRLHLFLDKSVMELFIQDGLTSVTRVSYPPDEDQDVFFFSEGGSAEVVSLDVWEMGSI